MLGGRATSPLVLQEKIPNKYFSYKIFASRKNVQCTLNLGFEKKIAANLLVRSNIADLLQRLGMEEFYGL